LRIVNFAHGEFYMVGGFAYVLLFHSVGAPIAVALPAAVFTGVVMGVVVERLLIKPLYSDFRSWRHGRDEYAIIVTFGLSLLLIATMYKLVGPWSLQGPRLVNAPPIVIAGLRVPAYQVASLAIAVVFYLLVLSLLHFTLWGRQIKAVAQNRFGASIMGVDVGRTSMLVLAAAGGLPAPAGPVLSATISP